MSTPTATLATCGICGLFCPACSVYIASTDDPARQEAFMKMMGLTREEATCHGCRSDVVFGHCKTCNLKACAQAKGIAFCAGCSEFCCNAFRDFAAGRLADPMLAEEKPHRCELMDDCEAIQQDGWQGWASNKLVDYGCPSCGTLNSAYDLTCRRCGHDPASPFVARNREKLVRLITPHKGK